MMFGLVKSCRKFLLPAFLALAAAGSAQAECLTPNTVAIRANLPDYPFWRLVAEEMEQCGNVEAIFGFDAVSVFPTASAPDRDLGSLVGVSNAALARLNSQNLLRPLDDLVEKYRDKLHDRQLIRVDGRILAIAVTANVRALMVHRDLFLQEGIEIPETYDALLNSAERLEGKDLFERPLALPFKAGWNLTQAFIEDYLAAGGSLLDPANQPLLNGEIGVRTLERMKALAGFLQDDYLDTADVAQTLDDLLKFRAPMSVLWISSAGPLENPAVSRVAGKMQYLRAPAIMAGGPSASTLWWDGLAIPVSATNEEAEAAFVTALEGLDAEMLEKYHDSAFWLVKDYVPGVLTEDLLAAIDSGDSGLRPYPASQALELLHLALGPHIERFMKGEASAEEALKAGEADYLLAAAERGIDGF